VPSLIGRQEIKVKYRAKQEVEARQIIGDPAAIVALIFWCNGKPVDSVVEGVLFHVPTGKKDISVARVNDWVIKDGDEFVVMKDAEFKRRYTAVQEAKTPVTPKAEVTK